MESGKKLLKCGVVIDKWKLPIFEKILKREKFKYKKKKGITRDTLSLFVYSESVAKLQPFIQEANDECRKSLLR